MPDTELKERYKQRRQDMIKGAQRRLDQHQGGRAIVKFVSAAVDGLLVDLWREVAGERADEVDLVAVGGYGRAELCPQSDWDLLFVVPESRDSERMALIQRYAQLVWDGLPKNFNGISITSSSYGRP